MPSVPSWLPLRESRNFILACAVVFLTLLTIRIVVDKPDKEEKAMEKRKKEGKVIAPEAYVPIWLYKGLRVNLAIAGALLLASPWLGRRRREGLPLVEAPPAPAIKTWEVIACVALMGLAAWHNAPRLSQSMWGDEEFNASRFMIDELDRLDDGSIHIHERDWATTLWNMRKPTNHLGYSFFARLTHDTFFEKKTGPTDPWFSEALLRTPVFIAGLLLIPAFLWALRVWGLRPWWGLLLLLLHPWYTRYGVEGRGYGFIMLGSALMLGVLGRALQTGRWRWWVTFGLLGFFLVWSNLQGVYPVAALNLTAFVCLLRRDLVGPSRWLLASRWFVANMITLMLIVGYLAPCWPQLQEFMAKGEIRGTLDRRFWMDGTCAWFFGQPFQPWEEPQNPYRYAMQISMQTLPWLHWVGIAFFILLAVTGILTLLKNRLQRPLVIFTLGAPALMLLHMAVSHNRPYDWYFTSFLPGLFLMAAAAAEATLRVVPKRAVAVAGLVAVVGLYAFVTWQPRQLLRNHSLEQSRESVPYYRTKVTNPRHPDIEKDVISAGFTMYTEGYDPALLRFNSVEELRKLMEKADASGRRLAVNVAYLKFARLSAAKDICVVLESSGQFEHVTTLYGLLPYTTRDVFLYKGKTP